MNVHDPSAWGLLEQSGYDAAGVEHDADLVVINTCSVREPPKKSHSARREQADGARAGPRSDCRRRRLRCAAEGSRLIRRSIATVDMGSARSR